jgi:hypothetical protein
MRRGNAPVVQAPIRGPPAPDGQAQAPRCCEWEAWGGGRCAVFRRELCALRELASAWRRSSSGKGEVGLAAAKRRRTEAGVGADSALPRARGERFSGRGREGAPSKRERRRLAVTGTRCLAGSAATSGVASHFQVVKPHSPGVSPRASPAGKAFVQVVSAPCWEGATEPTGAKSILSVAAVVVFRWWRCRVLPVARPAT